jgi:hypothetical protein
MIWKEVFTYQQQIIPTKKRIECIDPSTGDSSFGTNSHIAEFSIHQILNLVPKKCHLYRYVESAANFKGLSQDRFQKF